MSPRRMSFRSLFIALACAGPLLLGLRAADAGKPRTPKPAWDAPAFQADADALLAAANAVHVDGKHDAVILLEEGHYDLEADGRSTLRFHRIVKVLRPEGVDRWGNTTTGWAQWYQKQPTLRARVITPDGDVHTLDPKTIEVGPASRSSEHIYSDHRSVRAPFPAVGVGSIIELEIVTEDKAPFFAAGDLGGFYFGASVPIQTARLTIDAPPKLTVHQARYLAPKNLRIRKQNAKGRIRWIYEASDLPPDPDVEARIPGDAPRYARIAFATGRSWRAVATAYERIVEDQIAAGGIRELIKGLPARGGDRDATVAAVLARLNDNVRYSGLEFGKSSIVPWTPAETWKRRYGDCKDKAILLVAMLREVGVEAHVALLNAGILERDVDPTLPGLGHFDHVIVRVGGEDPIWIDPTSEYARAGELPINDQGRWALVADARTKELVRTPVAPAQSSTFSEVREVQLAERGPSRIVEVSRFTGWYEQKFRYDYRDSDPAKLRDSIERYAKSEYAAKEMVDFAHSEVGDLAKPFELRIEVTGAERAFTDTNEAAVWMFPNTIADEVPAEMVDADEAKQPREAPLVVLPFVREIEYRVKTPPGFRANPLPTGQRLAIGAGVLTTSFRADGDTLIASLRFDSGPLVYSAAQVMAARKALRALNKADAIKLSFEQIGEAHLAAGRTAEAIEEFRRLVALHPEESLHHQQLASALLQAGLGMQARDEARRAVAMDKKSPSAYGTLGWVLQHDEFGRKLFPGADRAGAEKAYRAGVALDGTLAWLRGNLAILLDRGEWQQPYGGDLAKAIAEYEALRANTDSKEYDINLLEALLHAGRFDQLVAVARTMASDQTVAALRVAAAAAAGGATARDDEIGKLKVSASDRQTVLQTAGEYLVQIRRYPAAAEVMKLGLTGVGDAQLLGRTEVLAKTRRLDEPPYTRTDPRRPVGELLFVIFDEQPLQWKVLQDLFSRRVGALPDGTLGRVQALGDFRAGMRNAGLSSEVLLDVIFGMVELEVDDVGGDAWRVRVVGRPPMPRSVGNFYVVRERKRYKLLGSNRDHTLLGLHALDLVQSGKLDSARTLLGWVADDTGTAVDLDVPYGSEFLAIWQSKQLDERKRVELAAAALAATGGYGEPALGVLARCPRSPDAVTRACAQAAMWSHIKREEYTAALERANELLAGSPDNGGLQVLRADLLLRADRAPELRDLATKRLADDPESTIARRWLARVAIAENDLAGSFAEYQRIAAGKDFTATDLNEYAWLGLFLDDTGDEVLGAAQRAATMTRRAQSNYLNTLAAVHAARGEYSLAQQVLIESMVVDDAAEPREQDWLVHGRIVAGYGFADDARAAYGRIPTPRKPVAHNSLTALARKWRADLGEAAPAKQRRRAR